MKIDLKKILIFHKKIYHFYLFGYFLILTTWQLGILNLNPQTFGFSIFQEPKKIYEIWIMNTGDMAYYFGAALSWHENGVLRDSEWQWVTNLWPPGMPLTHYFFLRLTDGTEYFLLTLYLMTALAWTLLFTFVTVKSLKKYQILVIVSLTAAVFSTPFQAHIFSSSFALPSGYAVLAFLYLNLIVRLFKSRNFKQTLIIGTAAGILLGVAALYRITFYFFVIILLLASILIVVFYVLNKAKSLYILDKKYNTALGLQFNQQKLLLALITLFSTVLVLTWTTIVSERTHPNKFTYVVDVPGLSYGMKWRTDSDLISSNLKWAVDANTNWACNLDLTVCEEIRKKEEASPNPYSGFGYYSGKELRNLALSTAWSNPARFISHRAPFLWTNWQEGNLIEGVVFLIILLLAVAIALKKTLQSSDLTSFLFLLAIISSAGPLVWILFNGYYFIPIKVISFLYLTQLFLVKIGQEDHLV